MGEQVTGKVTHTQQIGAVGPPGLGLVLRLTNSPQKAICVQKPNKRCQINNSGKQQRKDYKEEVQNDLQELKQKIIERNGDLLYKTLWLLQDCGAKE
jgi:hypothetical protein